MAARRMITPLAMVLCAMATLPSCKDPAPQSTPPGQPGETNEYPLPANGIPEEVRARLHPWIAGFIGLTKAEANERLRNRWEPIARPSLQALRETLGAFDVKAIADLGEGGVIYAARPGADEDSIGNFFFLPGPLDRSEIEQRLKPSGLDGNEALREFLHYFGGLAEDTDTAGQFLYGHPPWPQFTDSWDGSIESFDEWKNALMLYHARNGCFILVREDGKVGWWVMQEALVATEAEDFDQFILKFNEHRKIAWPYDPYGPPDDY